jgi:hypothetical protein
MGDEDEHDYFDAEDGEEADTKKSSSCGLAQCVLCRTLAAIWGGLVAMPKKAWPAVISLFFYFCR